MEAKLGGFDRDNEKTVIFLEFIIFVYWGSSYTLINSVLLTVPMYWMSMYHLPNWVIKAIDRIRRDFLWSGPDIDHPGCRLVAWKNICRAKEQEGWGIRDLNSFNLALLGEWM